MQLHKVTNWAIIKDGALLSVTTMGLQHGAAIFQESEQNYWLQNMNENGKMKINEHLSVWYYINQPTI